jgi:desulfoferrodoxin
MLFFEGSYNGHRKPASLQMRALWKHRRSDSRLQRRAAEKHVPVIEKVGGGVKVTVGSVAHPMEDDHYIEWIELVVDGKAYRQFLKPGQAPEAVFNVEGDNILAREYCNLHGHWKG